LGTLGAGLDVKAVTEGGGDSLSPTGPTILGDVLVLVPCDVVGSVDVPPVPVLGEVVGGDNGMGARIQDDLLNLLPSTTDPSSSESTGTLIGSLLLLLLLNVAVLGPLLVILGGRNCILAVGL
jgi:hypothetical protein